MTREQVISLKIGALRALAAWSKPPRRFRDQVAWAKEEIARRQESRAKNAWRYTREYFCKQPEGYYDRPFSYLSRAPWRVNARRDIFSDAGEHLGSTTKCIHDFEACAEYFHANPSYEGRIYCRPAPRD